jgi:hypothetical protein
MVKRMAITWVKDGARSAVDEPAVPSQVGKALELACKFEASITSVGWRREVQSEVAGSGRRPSRRASGKG